MPSLAGCIDMWPSLCKLRSAPYLRESALSQNFTVASLATCQSGHGFCRQQTCCSFHKNEIIFACQILAIIFSYPAFWNLTLQPTLKKISHSMEASAILLLWMSHFTSKKRCCCLTLCSPSGWWIEHFDNFKEDFLRLDLVCHLYCQPLLLLPLLLLFQPRTFPNINVSNTHWLHQWRDRIFNAFGPGGTLLCSDCATSHGLENTPSALILTLKSFEAKSTTWP